MWIKNHQAAQAAVLSAAAFAFVPAIVACGSPASAQVPFSISRANLAKTASFTVTQTLAPKGSDKIVRVYHVEVAGNNARLDYDDPSVGAVRYLANAKGVYFYIPGNKSAVKQNLDGGVEGALKVAFAQVKDQLASAKKVGAATVSGQKTIAYKDPKNGTMVYLGTNPGFKLPVKTVVTNVGGSSTLLVSDIKLNAPISAARFALPSGTQMMDGGSAPAGSLGGIGGGR